MSRPFAFFSLVLLITFFAPTMISAQDTTRIVTHKQIKVVTDPANGEKTYPASVDFPTTDKSIRKINLLVTFQCPDSLQCGEWDYIDYINLKTNDPDSKQPVSYEIARLITPYGRFFGTSWSFTFKADISEFASLLHNQATIEYVHSGYESDKTCGWKITVTFELISGPPVARILSVIPMWNGKFPYGDTVQSIEQYLDVKKITATEKTGLLRLRVIQTGHGMDSQENCAEFCSKYRDIYFDQQLVDHRNIWKTCGTNPVYPQAGTWVYDRANWCPGCMVDPESFNFFVQPGSAHEINIDMQPYQVTKGEVTANYVFSSFLVMMEKPRATNDAGIEAIIAPSDDDNFSRLNPVGFQSQILVKNNGNETLRSLKIQYGFTGQQPLTYTWIGELAFGKTTRIDLPGVLASKEHQQVFTALISKPNNHKDEYPGDNQLSSIYTAPPIYPETFLVAGKTNKDSSQTAWKISDASGKIWFQKKESDLPDNTEFRDTVALPQGQYQLIVSDTGGDGLEFWANPRAGMGYVKLVSLDGKLIKAFGSDFGSEIRQSFTVDHTQPLTAFQNAQVLVYPHRPNQNTTLMLFFNEPQTVHTKLTTADGQLLQESTYYQVRENNFLIDLSGYKNGTYLLELKYGDKTESIRLKKAGRK